MRDTLRGRFSPRALGHAPGTVPASNVLDLADEMLRPRRSDDVTITTTTCSQFDQDDASEATLKAHLDD